jgi:hypothetical protein
MLRKSGLPGSSTSSSSSNSAVVTARWIEKKKEHDLLLELEKQSALYVARLKALQEDCHEMAEAGAGQYLIPSSHNTSTNAFCSLIETRIAPDKQELYMF